MNADQEQVILLKIQALQASLSNLNETVKKLDEEVHELKSTNHDLKDKIKYLELWKERTQRSG